MIKKLSEVSYENYTCDASTLDTKELNLGELGQRPLPKLSGLENLEDVLEQAEGNGESLVKVEHRKILDLSLYQQVGWNHTRTGIHLREQAAGRLKQVAENLPDSFGLAVFDSWRCLNLQHEIYQAAYQDESLPVGFVNPPSTDRRKPPPHLTGGTVDLTLTFEGKPLGLGTCFDAFEPDAYTDAFEHKPGAVRDLRRFLYWAMRAGGFIVLHQEWWHFEYGTRHWGSLCGRTPLYGPSELR